MKKITAALIGLTLCASANAEFWSGNNLYSRMASSSPADNIQAIGYIMGAFDVGQGIFHCAPRGPGITAGQVQDIVKKYMESFPEKRHETADMIVNASVASVWPCQNRNRNTL